jgi:hypothetical protein
MFSIVYHDFFDEIGKKKSLPPLADFFLGSCSGATTNPHHHKKINDGALEKGWYWGDQISLCEVHPPIEPHKSEMAEHLATAPECQCGDLWKGDEERESP